MRFQGRDILVCNCEKTMRLDGGALAGALGEGGPAEIHSHLCRSQIARFEAALEGGEPLLVACTQEAPLFGELAAERGAEERLRFTNIRERAGWSEQGAEAGPKIAALLAESVHESRPARLASLVSDGVCLVYGRGQAALDTARALSGRLSVSLLLSAEAEEAIPPDVADIAVHRGRIRAAQGAFGRFEVTVDGYAPMLPSSRAFAHFAMARDGAKAGCSLILDMSGESALFPAGARREGYLRVDPRDPAALARAMFDISALVGEFEKPIYVDYDPDICAHSRSRITGCTNCLDACPTGAISPAGDTVAIDEHVCAGCGTCSAVCPTGAVSYAYPPREDLITRIQILARVHRRAGGAHPKLLVHDESHGAPLIAAMARAGRGLPASVIPLSTHSVLQTGHDILAAAFAAGFEDVVLLADPRHADEAAGLAGEIALMNALMAAWGHHGARVHLIEEADPDAAEAALHALPARAPLPAREIAPLGGKRTLARAMLATLNEAAPARQNVVALEPGAPYGRIQVDADGCTLCLACVSACPADAILDNPDKPQIRFVEQACVQCGLCAATCPENVITLEPRINFAPAAMTPVVLNEEEPFACVSCGKDFGTRKTIDRIVERLQGKHWMYRNEEAARLIQMCETCRVTAQAASPDDPLRLGTVPRVRTTEDYLKAREAGRDLTAEDFLQDE